MPLAWGLSLFYIFTNKNFLPPPLPCRGYETYNSTRSFRVHNFNDEFFRIYKYIEDEQEETIEDMMEKYNIALNDKEGKMKLLNQLLDDYTTYKNQVLILNADTMELYIFCSTNHNHWRKKINK